MLGIKDNCGIIVLGIKDNCVVREATSVQQNEVFGASLPRM